MAIDELIIKILPVWLIFALATVTMIHRLYVAWRWELCVISRWENLLYAIALLNIALFYAGLEWNWWSMGQRIAVSRVVWVWLLVVSLHISHRMSKRHNG